MKKFTYLFIYFMLFSMVAQAENNPSAALNNPSESSQPLMMTVFYVNHAATGANNGSSWADAFTDLADALNTANDQDEIWVAQGTYMPGGNNPGNFSHYSMTNDIKLYGGFNGTETQLNQRDYDTYITILNGDVLGDDIDGDVNNNRYDNIYQIMIVGTSVTDAVIDGFTIRNGHADVVGVSSGNERLGGGIYCSGQSLIMNCTFKGNYAQFSGGGLYITDNIGTRVEDCTFLNNVAESGAGIGTNKAECIIKNCYFDGNKGEYFAGGVVIVDSKVDIQDCLFENNTGFSAGAIYAWVFDSTTTNVNIIDCEFRNNSIDYGAGAILAQANINIVSSIFHNNTSATGPGGAIFLLKGILSTDLLTMNITDCTFTDNNALEKGGAIYAEESVNITSSTFHNNTTGQSGGAVFLKEGDIPNDSLRLNITDCEFTDNEASDKGGAIYVEANMDIMSSIFNNNTAGEAGGAIALKRGNIAITNALMTNNTANGNGLGGAIHLDALSKVTDLTIINSTIANNNGTAADGIYHKVNAKTKLSIGNTILRHDNNNYGATNTSGIMTSLGGNLSSDNTLASLFNTTADINDTDPLFADPTNNDFHLQNGSPAQDIGIVSNAPLLDLDSLPRVGLPDAGAYEHPFLVATEKHNVLLNKDLKVFPNPPVDRLTLEINNDWSGEVQFQLIDGVGRVIKQWTNDKYGTVHQEVIAVQDLAGGVYQIAVTQEREKRIVRFTKL